MNKTATPTTAIWDRVNELTIENVDLKHRISVLEKALFEYSNKKNWKFHEDKNGLCGLNLFIADNNGPYMALEALQDKLKPKIMVCKSGDSEYTELKR